MGDLSEENRVLRERVAQLEKALASGVDPILRSLGEHAASYLNVTTPDGRFLATGRPSEAFGSVVGRSVDEFLDPASVPVLRAAFAKAVETGLPQVYESVGYGEDGTPGHTYLTRVVPLREDDEVIALVMVPTDITERVKLERTLVEQKHALQVALDASHMGLWHWDVASNEIVWDKRLREIWSVNETPRDFHSYLALVHPDDRSTVEDNTRDALATGTFRAVEHRIVARKDIPERWILAAGTVVKDAQGKPTRLMGGALDITEQKQLAAHLQRAERVESVGQLAAGIAHNFNNLLAAIIPNLELSLPSVNEQHRPGLSAALDASLQARDLVRSLMSLTQRGATRSEVHSDIREIVQRVDGICRVTFPREIALRHRIQTDVPHVAMQPGDLEQVLLNLLLNARDAIEDAKGITREISVEVDQVHVGAGPQVRVRITDTGTGMSDEVRARIFDPFFTTKPPHKGSGLGLANVATSVRDAGGAISCETFPGLGSTFTVLLPPSQRVVPELDSKPLAAPKVAGGETILLIDDEPLVRGVMRRLLESERYVVLEAVSAAEGRDLLQREGARIGLVILDQSMPRETGTQALPSLLALTTAPIVLFTGMAPDLPEGIAALLEKPARPSELQALVRDVLDKHR